MKIIAWFEEEMANVVESIDGLEVEELDFDCSNVQVAITCTPATASAIANGLVKNYNAFSVDVISDEDFLHEHSPILPLDDRQLEANENMRLEVEVAMKLEEADMETKLATYTL